MFGERIVGAFGQVKSAFDPAGLLNPNRIVDPPRMDDRSLLRYPPGYGAAPGFTPKLDWSAWPGPLGGMLGAVEMCNNNGTCRSFDAGVMCPSYRATRDEKDVTRGRANTLRLALTGQLGPDAMAGEAVAEAMALCVSCKACRRECPTGVDMAKMKIEVQAARAEKHGVKLREKLVAALPRLAPLASRFPMLANLRNKVPALRALSQMAGFAASRDLPEFAGNPFRNDEADANGDVLLLADTFNRHFEPEILRDAVKVLRAAGLRVEVAAGWDGRNLCCGRTYLSAGMVERAREEARRMLEALAGDRPVIGLEPSCLMTLRDEFAALLPGAAAESLGRRAVLLGEFLAKEAPKLPLQPLKATAHVHGHCHAKSFGAFLPGLAALRAVPELAVKPIASSCCGMAGAFGYQAETQDTSRAMAEAGLLPAVRAAAAEDLIVADGTSCRHQIESLGGRRALHSVQVLARALG
jgi:Fe-S oxidoreductase